MLIVVFIIDLIGIYFYYLKKNNSYFSDIQLLIETLTLYYYFFRIFSTKFVKIFISLLAIFFTTTWMISGISIGLKKTFDICANIQNVSILALTLYYFYEQVIKINTIFIYKEHRFWIVAAYFIYFSGIFFLFIYIPSLSQDDLIIYYSLNYVFIIIRSALLSIAMFVKPALNNFHNPYNVSPKNYS